ncbi:MAG: NADH-quinone oxidoreductase subunit N [Actinobacteria bacterium]|nr:NADH-quinone oxidoreductase subunit N [Actinomycetota bacterium]
MMLAANMFVGPAIDWMKISPLLVMLGGVLLLILGGSLTPQWKKGAYGIVGALTAAGAAVLTAILWRDLGNGEPTTLIANALTYSKFSLFATFTIAVGTLLAIFVTSGFLVREGEDGPEVFALILSASIGGMVMVQANDLIVMFLGLETLSLAFYLLTASSRNRTASGEAGLKYFVLGGFASAFFLYGVALVFGATGSTNIDKIATSLSANTVLGGSSTMLLAGIALLLVGFGFKVSLVPFHTWTADVYQGAPTPITALMGSVGKTAAFVALIRVFTGALGNRSDDWGPVVVVLAVLTLVVGSVLAVVQTDVKRMLAFSSISHAGFILVGLAAASKINSSDAGLGSSNALGYLFIYSILVVGTLAVVTIVAGKGDAETSLDAFKGLGKSHPVLAMGMTVLLLAQAGVPLTSGFVAKFGIIRAAVSTESYVLAVVAMLAAVIAAFLYLRIMVSMWLSESESTREISISLISRLTMLLCVAGTLAIGMFPSLLLQFTNQL